MFLLKLLIFLFVFNLPALSAAEEINTDVRFLHVQKGQTLHNIVRRLYPARVNEWPKISSDIVRLNPQAFISNDPTKIKAGARLTLPDKVVVRSGPIKPVEKLQVGIVLEHSGSAIAVDRRRVSRKLYKESPVFLGDKVITGEDGFVRLQMIDDAILDLRCFSIMVIEEYALKDGNRRSILNLLQGSLRKVTGSIGKLTEDVYELRTPVASVGIRGTEYALRVFQSKGCGGMIDADDGFYLEVIKGLVDVHNEAGHQVFARGETAYVALPESRPKKQDIKPGILPQSANESQLQNEQDSASSLWWWLLGIIPLALLI